MSRQQWTETTVGTVAKVKSGFAFKSSDWVEAGVPVVKIANVHNGAIELSGCAFVNEEIANQASEYYLDPGDILITMTGRIGEVARVPQTPRMLLNQRVGRFSVEDSVDTSFLFHSLRDPSTRKRMEAHAYGVAQPNISPSLIEAIPLRVPPPDTQRKIAAVLSAYDDLIANNLRRIEILEQMARTIYREWFVEFRFPGHEGVRMVESELGPIPAGWAWVPPGELLGSFIGGDWGSESPTDENTEGVAVIRGADIRPLGLGESDVPQRFIPTKRLLSRELRPGDLVVENSVNSTTRSVGSSLFVTDGVLRRVGSPAVCASFCKRFRLVDPTLTPIIHLFLGHLRNEGLMEKYQNVATNGIANFQAKRFVEDAQVPLPLDHSLRTRLGERLSPFFDSTLADRVHLFRQTRDLLLPKLVSGELDVSDLDIDMGELVA